MQSQSLIGKVKQLKRRCFMKKTPKREMFTSQSLIGKVKLNELI